MPAPFFPQLRIRVAQQPLSKHSQLTNYTLQIWHTCCTGIVHNPHVTQKPPFNHPCHNLNLPETVHCHWNNCLLLASGAKKISALHKFMPSSSSIHFRQLDQHCTAAIPTVCQHLPEFIWGIKQREQFVSLPKEKSFYPVEEMQVWQKVCAIWIEMQFTGEIHKQNTAFSLDQFHLQ